MSNTLTAAEWQRFVDDANRSLAVTRRDAIWEDGEFIDRSFGFVWKAGSIVGGSEAFGTTSGAPAVPLEDPRGAFDSLLAGAVNFPLAIANGAIRYPHVEVQVTNWLFPHVVCLEVNYVTTPRRAAADRPVARGSWERYQAIKQAILTGLPHVTNEADGFVTARHIQTTFSASFEDGSLVEVREEAFGDQPDYLYDEPERLWAEFCQLATSPLPNLVAGAYGPDAFIAWRVLRHGTMGHAGLFIRPATRLGA